MLLGFAPNAAFAGFGANANPAEPNPKSGFPLTAIRYTSLEGRALQDDDQIARLETQALSPKGDCSMDATLSATSAQTVDDVALAKGSQGDDVSKGELEAAPTLAAGSGEGAPASAPEAALENTRIPAIAPGAKLGRLELGATLGSGAFGVVVAAYDPELKRKLAVKILRPEVFGSSSGKDAQTRLLREARAMARISHPNVVTVHDIGTVDGQVFVAMEFIDGSHLRGWLDEEKRTWRQIVAKFTLAGRGLAAAHSAGLVHRDFKPDNVLVSSRGDVRVADFGLVSISANRNEAKAVALPVAPRTNSDELGITRIGAVMGTALYMAPEQHRGREAGPPADQFAFCAALYWALYNQTPYEGRNYKELRANVLAGKLLDPAAECRQPKWLWPILRRGMSTDPLARYASMDELLVQLQHDPAKRRNARLKLGAAALLTAGAVAGVFLSRPSAVPVCQGAEERLVGTWGAASKSRIESVYAKSARQQSYERLVGAVDSYTGEWVLARTRVCEATHVVGDQSAALLDVRMSCLDGRLGDLRALLERLDQRVGGVVLDKAVTAAFSLQAIESCTGAESSSQLVALPSDPTERAAIEELRAEVSKAKAFAQLGKAAEAEAILQTIVASPVQFPPLQAGANKLLGDALADLGKLSEAEAALHKSIEYATVAGKDIAVASGWLALMHLEGVERENYHEGLEMGRLAKLALTRGKASGYKLAGVDKSRATILLRQGRAAKAVALLEAVLPNYQESADEAELAFFFSTLGDAKAADARYKDAVADYRLSLAHLESAFGREHLENVYVLNNLSVTLKNLGETGEARSALERSLKIVEATFGPVHRNVVPILTNLGNLARRDGNNEEAKRIFTRAINVGNEVLEPGHPNVSKAIMNLGIVLASEGDFEGATGRFLVVLERSRRSFKGDHPDVAMALNNVGESLSLETKYSEGLEYVREALEMKTRLYGEDHPKCASSIATVGTTLAKMGKLADAESYLVRAHDIYVEAAGETHSLSIKLMSELGALHLQAGEPPKAVSYLQRAIAARGEVHSTAQGQDRLRLAKALWARSSRKAAAVEEAALEALIEANGNAGDLAIALREWRSER